VQINMAAIGKSKEACEFMHIARRIASLLVLNEALDSNYRLV
jgi:hypothetical protein